MYSIPKLRLLVEKIISTKTQKDNIFGKTQMEVTPKHFITGVKTRNFDLKFRFPRASRINKKKGVSGGWQSL